MRIRLGRGAARVIQGALLAAALAALSPAAPAFAQCAVSATNQTCTNPAGTTISPNGISDNNDARITNLGIILSTSAGIFANNDAFVTNSGTISSTGGYGVFAINNAFVTNSGTIFGTTQYGVIGFNNATVVNSGSIVVSSSGLIGVYALNTFSLVNSGLISGPTGVSSGGGGIATLVNSGTIIGTGGTAIDFSFNAGGDTLTFLPGSRILGSILLSPNDNITFQSGRDIAKTVTFGCTCGAGLTDTGSIVNVTGGAPYVVSGDRVAILDPTAFNMVGRSLMDFTGNVSSLVGGRTGEAAAAGAGVTAFAPVSPSAASRVFDDFPAQAYSADRSMALLPGTQQADRASGITLWSSGFAAGRRQQADGPMLSASSMAYGGAVGADKRVAGDLLIGGFIGAGQGRVNVDMDSQKIDTDYVFGGVYGRYESGTHFTDFALSGGHSQNSSMRLVANNLAPNGLETATGSYGGWFISPELAYGTRLPFGNGNVLTPSARVRYLAGFLDGYSEAGSAQNLTVGSRMIQNVEERFELALSRVNPVQQGFLKVTATLGVLSVQRLGDTVNANLIGQDLSFSTPGQSVTAGLYSGFGVDYRITQRLGLFAAAEGTVMSDNSLTGIARAGLRAAF